MSSSKCSVNACSHCFLMPTPRCWGLPPALQMGPVRGGAPCSAVRSWYMVEPECLGPCMFTPFVLKLKKKKKHEEVAARLHVVRSAALRCSFSNFRSLGEGRTTLSPAVLGPDSARAERKGCEAIKRPGGKLFFNQVGLCLLILPLGRGRGQKLFSA